MKSRSHMDRIYFFGPPVVSQCVRIVSFGSHHQRAWTGLLCLGFKGLYVFKSLLSMGRMNSPSTVYMSWTEVLHTFFLLCFKYKVLFSQRVLSVIWKFCLVLVNFFSASHVGSCLLTLIKRLYKQLTCEIFSWGHRGQG